MGGAGKGCERLSLVGCFTICFSPFPPVKAVRAPAESWLGAAGTPAELASSSHPPHARVFVSTPALSPSHSSITPCLHPPAAPTQGLPRGERSPRAHIPTALWLQGRGASTTLLDEAGDGLRAPPVVFFHSNRFLPICRRLVTRSRNNTESVFRHHQIGPPLLTWGLG